MIIKKFGGVLSKDVNFVLNHKDMEYLKDFANVAITFVLSVEQRLTLLVHVTRPVHGRRRTQVRTRHRGGFRRLLRSVLIARNQLRRTRDATI